MHIRRASCDACEDKLNSDAHPALRECRVGCKPDSTRLPLMVTTGRRYLRLVWNRAWSFAWSATRSWSGLAAIGVGLASLFIPYVANWRANASWQIPLVLLVALLVYGFTKASYSLFGEKEALARSLEERLADYINHRTLADELTERYEMATHHLLNVIKPDDEPGLGWIQQANVWRLSVLDILQKHGCSKQEVTHFEVINQFEVLSLRLPFATAMFLIRVGRLADISTEHVKIAESNRIRQ